MNTNARRCVCPIHVVRILLGRAVGIVVIAMTALPLAASSQTPPSTVPSTIQSATLTPPPLAELLQNSESLAAWLAARSRDAGAAAARVDQARALVGSAGLRPNLQIETGLGGLPLGETNPPGIGVGASINYGFNVSQQFEIGKRAPRIAAADLRLASQRYLLTDTLADALATAREAIARVLHSARKLDVLREGLEMSRQLLALQRVRFERGDLSGTDLDRLDLEVRVLESDLAQSGADYDDSLAACATVLFAPCEPGTADLEALSAGELLPDAVASTGDPVPTLLDRPDMQALSVLVDATRQDEALALKRQVPDPIVSAGYLRDRFLISGSNPHAFGLSVTLPLATSDRGQFDAARARAERGELEAVSASLVNRARNEVAALRQRYATLRSAASGLRTEALTQADAILAATAAAVTQGELSTTDLLLARRSRTEIALKVMEIDYQVFVTATRLRHVLGLDAPVVRHVQETIWPAK